MSEAAQIEALLRAVPFFTVLERVELARLAGVLEEVRYRKREVIFAEASEGDALYFVQNGWVSVSVRTPGGERTITDIRPGAYFGELGLLLTRHTASAIARTEVTVWKLPRDRFEEIVRESPTLGLRMASSLAALVDRRSREWVGAPVPVWETTPLVQERARPSPSVPRNLVALAITVGIPLLLWWTPPPPGLTMQGWHVILIVLGAAVGWLLEPVPDFVVTLLMAAAWGATGLAPLSSIFGGFASSSWVLGLGALALAAAMVRSGLMFRLSLAVLRRFSASQRGQVTALIVGGLLITPLVPLSLGRVAAIAPFAKELARALGYPDRSPGAAALALAGIVGYGGFSSIFLTGLAMNFFVFDLLPAAERLETTWFAWLLRAAPTGIVVLVGALVLFGAWFRPSREGTASNVERQEYLLGPISPRELVTVAALLLMLVGFLFQSVLRISPAWLGIVAIAIAIAGGSLNRERFRREIDWAFLVQFGILLSAHGVLQANDVDAWVAAHLLQVLGDGWHPATLVLVLALCVTIVRLFVPWIPATLLLSLALVPAAPSLGLSPWVVGFVVLVTANAWLLPNQSDYCRMARDAAGDLFEPRHAMIVGAALTALTLVGLAVSIPYWHALGVLRP
jgi:di/tricarboxylate transporter